MAASAPAISLITIDNDAIATVPTRASSASSASSTSSASTTNAITTANPQMNAHFCNDTVIALNKLTTACLFTVNSFPGTGISPAIGHGKRSYLLWCKLLPAYPHHANTVFFLKMPLIFFLVLISFHVTVIVHNNNYQMYLLLLLILHVAAWTARCSAPFSMNERVLAILVQSNLKPWSNSRSCLP